MKFPYIEYHLQEAEEAITLLRKSSTLWRDKNVIFRGQPDSRKPLIPSAWRNQDLFRRIKTRIRRRFTSDKRDTFDEKLRSNITKITDNKEMAEKIYSYVWHITCEVYLVHEFISRSNAQALKVTSVNPFGTLNSIESIISLQENILISIFGVRKHLGILGQAFNPWQEDCKKVLGQSVFLFALIEYFSSSHFPFFALAQHHKTPTRFLDWSKDPSKACFFAIDALECDRSVEKENGQNLVVFGLETTHLQHSGIHITEDFPHYDFTFLHKQEGTFTYIPSADKHYLTHGSWPTIEDYMAPNINGRSSIYKITFDATILPELKKILAADGITKEALMPTYNHVSESMLMDLKNEADEFFNE